MHLLTLTPNVTARSGLQTADNSKDRKSIENRAFGTDVGSECMGVVAHIEGEERGERIKRRGVFLWLLLLMLFW
jgi:hypothetical protein